MSVICLPCFMISMNTPEITGEVKSANFGVTANAGIRFQHNRNYFSFEAGGNYGFIPVQTGNFNGNNRLGATSMMLGYAFSLF